MKRAVLWILAAASLAAAPGTAILTDDVYQLPPGDWRWVRFEIRQRPATVVCQFETLGDPGSIHAELVSRQDLDLFRQRKSHDTLAAITPQPRGTISTYIEHPGQYAAIIENAGSRPTAVHLSVSLAFAPPKPISRTLSPTRRLTVILISFACFFAIVTFSARALLKAMKRP